MKLSAKNDRIDLRLPRILKKRFQAVADLSGRSMSDFIIAAATEKADEAMASIERWTLDEQDSRMVMDLLLEPREVPRLRELLAASDPQTTVRT